jgi:hypothetical protein
MFKGTLKMSTLRPCALAFTLLTLAATTLPATAQYYPQAGEYQRPQSSNVIIGNGVQVGTPSSVIINGQGYYRYPQTQVIIIQQPAYYPQQVNNCTTAIVGSPVPLPYARDSVTGAICR